MKLVSTIFIIALMWTQTAFACPPWWAMYKPRLVFFGAGSAMAMSDPKTLAQRETMMGWQELTGLPESADLTALVYATSLEDIAALKAAAQGGAASPLAQNNAAAKALVAEKRLELLDYLLFLREMENAEEAPDPWEYKKDNDTPGQVSAEYSRWLAFFAQAEAAAQSDIPEALKRRYVFQMFRIAFSHHAGSIDDMNMLHSLFSNKVMAWPDDEPIKEWCRSYYAGLFYPYFCAESSCAENDVKITTFKDFAQVYAKSLRYRESAHVSLHFILRAQPDAGQKALELPGLHAGERAAIQQVLQSFNPDLEAVLTAHLEKGWILPFDIKERLVAFLNSQNDQNLVDLAPAIPIAPSSMEKLLLSMAAAEADPAPWYLGAADLAIVRGDAAEARRILRLAEQADQAQKYQGQLIALQALTRAYLEPLHERGEAELLAQLVWLIEGGQEYRRLWPAAAPREGKPEEAEFCDAVLEALMGTILPDRYTRQGRDERAALFLALWSTDSEDVQPYASAFPFWKLLQSPPGRLRYLAEILEKPQSPLEEFLVKAVPWTPDYPLELAATYYIHTHDFAKAADALAAIPPQRRRPWIKGSSNWETNHWYDTERGKSISRWWKPDKRGRTSMAGAHNPFEFQSQWVNDDDSLQATLFAGAGKRGLSAQAQEQLRQLTREPLTRFDFAGQMQQLKKMAAQQGEAGAMAGFYYGQALYNISWNGPSWRMSAWGRSDMEFVSSKLPCEASPYEWSGAQACRYMAIDPRDVYHYPANAHKELRRALTKTANPELKSRIIFMMAGMDQIDRPYTELLQQKKAHLRELAASFGDTAFARTAAKACPMLADFL